MGGAEDRPFFYAVSVGLVMVGVAYLLGWVSSWIISSHRGIQTCLISLSVVDLYLQANFIIPTMELQRLTWLTKVNKVMV